MEVMMRNFFQSLAKSPTANKLAKKYGLRFGAAKFVAGERIRHAMDAVARLNEQGMCATLDHLGEFVSSREEADEAAAMCIQTLDAIAESKVDSGLSLKLTSLGLDISRELCMENMKTILQRAQKHNLFVRIDMEDYAHCQVTLDILSDLRASFDNVGTVLQAYLYRTEQDIDDLNRLNANLRLVKGAYKESPEVAYPDKADVDRNFNRIIQRHLQNGNYTAVATHDPEVIRKTIDFIQKHQIPNTQFEFQMLYGISTDLQKRLVKEGYKVRVYVPYGHDWFGYFMRRMAERPANVWFVVKNMWK